MTIDDESCARSPTALLLACVGPAIAVTLMQLPVPAFIVPAVMQTPALLSELMPWAIAAFVIIWVLIVERRPLASIGFRKPDARSLRLAAWTAAFISAVMVLQFFFILPWLGLTQAAHERQHILAFPWWLRLLTVIRAAVTEEIIYRGFLTERALWITRSSGLALGISVFAFAAAHLHGWGAAHLIPAAIAGAAFGLLYLARRNLPANILAHFITDAGGFLFG